MNPRSSLLNRDVAVALASIYVLVVPRNVLRLLIEPVLGRSLGPFELLVVSYAVALLFAGAARRAKTYRELPMLERSLLLGGVIFTVFMSIGAFLV